MSISASSLSAGVQVLANDGLIPSSVTSQQLQTATPSQLLQLEVNNVESSALSSVFSGSAPTSDSVSLSGNPASSLLGGSSNSNSGTTSPLLQALESAVSNISSTTTATTAATDSSATTDLADATSETIGTLFSYLG